MEVVHQTCLPQACLRQALVFWVAVAEEVVLEPQRLKKLVLCWEGLEASWQICLPLQWEAVRGRQAWEVLEVVMVLGAAMEAPGCPRNCD